MKSIKSALSAITSPQKVATTVVYRNQMFLHHQLAAASSQHRWRFNRLNTRLQVPVELGRSCFPYRFMHASLDTWRLDFWVGSGARATEWAAWLAEALKVLVTVQITSCKELSVWHPVIKYFWQKPFRQTSPVGAQWWPRMLFLKTS